MTLDSRARALVGGSGPLAQRVHTPVDVGVVLRVVADEGIDHGLRLLAGGRAVEIHERLAVDFLVQDREVLADTLDVPVGVGDHAVSLTARPVSRAISKRSRYARIGATVIPSTTSRANP